MGFSRQEYSRELPFPSPVDHILSDLSTLTCPSWVAPWAWLSFIELDKAVVRVIQLTSFLWLWFVCLPSDAFRNTYHLTWVSLTLDKGYLLTTAPPDLEHGVAPLGPPAPVQPPSLELFSVRCVIRKYWKNFKVFPVKYIVMVTQRWNK